MQKSMSLKYEPSSEPLHNPAKHCPEIENCIERYNSQFENSLSDPSWRTSDLQTWGHTLANVRRYTPLLRERSASGQVMNPCM